METKHKKNVNNAAGLSTVKLLYTGKWIHLDTRLFFWK